ncbi:MAG: hypothetical protein RMK20_13510 [Verrucomicrobiales bacterium]|nr:hypothetical protein [Verrucomicrobiales bacterium]
MKNEILEEVWRIREQISAEGGHDVAKLAEMLRRKEAQYATGSRGCQLSAPQTRNHASRKTAAFRFKILNVLRSPPTHPELALRRTAAALVN